MSIFSSIRKSRQHVKEHNAKLAELKKHEEDATPYRHVPTHAASDAFASAPPSWREAADRPRIAEENRRRSAMAANGHHMGMPTPNFPRVGSSLSYVSYPGQATSPGPSRLSGRMPRAYSYTGVSPYHDGSRDVIYSIPDVAQSEPDGFDFKQSSPVESNSGSSSSQEDLEIKASKTSTAQPTTASATHRLHPSSRSRRTSDASLDRRAMTNSASHKAGPSTSSRDSRPPPSTRGFSSIPPSANPFPMQVGTAPRPLPADAIAPHAQEPQQFSAESSRQNSESSLPGLTPTSTGLPSPSAPASPSALSTPPSDFFLGSPLEGGRYQQTSYFPGFGGRTPENETEETSAPKTSRFTEITSSSSDETQTTRKAHSVIVNYLPEPVVDDTASTTSKSKGKKLTKGKGKLVKKSRRSTVEASA